MEAGTRGTILTAGADVSVFARSSSDFVYMHMSTIVDDEKCEVSYPLIYDLSKERFTWY